MDTTTSPWTPTDDYAQIDREIRQHVRLLYYAYKREAVGSTPTAPTRSEHMWIFKKIDCGLKVVPLVQPEVLDSGRATNARGILRAPQGHRAHRH